MTERVLGLVGSAAGGLEEIRAELVTPLIDHGWRVAITLTPSAATWLSASGELAALEQLTGLPVRSEPRLPGETSPHPKVRGYAVIPASATTIAKMALGLGDNHLIFVATEDVREYWNAVKPLMKELLSA